MKHWLCAIALICFCSIGARAESFNQNCNIVNIATGPATELTLNISTSPSTVPPASVWAVKVTNLDTAASLFCSQSVSISTSGAHQGDGPILPATATQSNYLWWIINSARDWYCISSGASPTRASVCLTN